MLYWTGIGSRQTPPPALELLERTAAALMLLGYTLRSGHADGADQACERGAGGNAEIYLPWPTFNANVPVVSGIHVPKVIGRPSLDAIRLAVEIHPLGHHLSDRVLALHGRNSHEVLGEQLDEPSKFVLCWTPDGSVDGSGRFAGGTGQALRLAACKGIQVFNLAREEHAFAVATYVTYLERQRGDQSNDFPSFMPSFVGRKVIDT
jgi:hypothetical protein